MESAERAKLAIISGLWANTNLDGEKQGDNPRQPILDQIEDNFLEAVINVYTPEEKRKKDEIDWEDPFFAAIKRSEVQQESSASTVPDRTTTTDFEIDQA